MGEKKGVWAFSENMELLKELLACGSPLAAKLDTELSAVLLGGDMKEKANELIKHGADRVLIVDNPNLRAFHIETCLAALTKLAKEKNPQIILIGATKNGKDLASRLATRLQTGCTPDCSQLFVDEEGWLTTKRIVFSGNAIVTASYLKTPQIATIPSRTFEKLEPHERTGNAEKISMSLEEPKVKIVKIEKMEATDVKIEEAKIVICGGRGVEKKEDFSFFKELARTLQGQIGNSRPLAEDRKWFSSWVGLSGKKIKPALYIGCGISGMIQHVAGMRDSQVVVAINKDPEAAIFEVADYIVVGDLYEILPAIVQELKKTLN